ADLDRRLGPFDVEVIYIDDALQSQCEADPAVAISEENAACILYTSGSAGEPKGVVRPHRAIVHRLTWMRMARDDVFCHNMSFSLGFSQERLFLPFMCGLPLAIAPEQAQGSPEKLVQVLASSGVTNLTMPPIMLDQLLQTVPDLASRLPRLRSVAVGGAPLSVALIETFVNLLPSVALIN